MNSHYVPQFILRGFCNNNQKLIYCDLDKKTTELRNTFKVFSEEGYYSNELETELNHKTESAFAKLYHDKLENAKKSIELTEDELFIIQKYLIVSSMRYKYELTENDKRCLSLIPEEKRHLYKIDSVEGLETILKFNSTGELLNYVNDVMDARYPEFSFNKKIKEMDANLQLFLETREVLTNHLIFVRPRENEEFIIPDIGRVEYSGKYSVDKIEFAFKMMTTNLFSGKLDPISMLLPKMLSPRDFMIYPLSKDLAIISMSFFYRLVSELAKRRELKNLFEFSESLGFSDNNILNVPPREKDGIFVHSIRRINTHDVCHLNCISINQAKHHIACSDLSRIQQSVQFAKEKIDRDISFLQL